MKVLQILPELNSGGVERGTLEVAHALVDAGHESLVVSNGGRLVPALEAAGSRHISLPVHRKSLVSLMQVRRLRRVFEQEKPDIVHARSRVPAWIAWLALRGMDAKTRPHFVTTVHGFYSVNAYSAIMTKGERVIAVSESVREYIARNYRKVNPSLVRVIHRGVDMQAFPYGYEPDGNWLDGWYREFPQTREQWLVTLPGRITRWKGQEDFIGIIGQLRNMGFPVHGLIVGDTHEKKRAYEKTLRTSVERAGLAAHVTFTGVRQDLREIMAISRVVLSLSADPEAFGRTTLEALSLGRAVAGYAHGGVAEQLAVMMPGGRIAPHDVSAMVRLLAGWIKEPPHPLRSELFTLDGMLARTLEVYREALDSQAR